MPSGKQILLEVLRDTSQSLTSGSNIEDVAERIRAAMLLHGSTGGEAWNDADDLTWASECDGEGRVLKQGLALKQGYLFLSGLFETIVEPDDIPTHVSSAHPELTRQQYHRATRFMWLVLSSIQWFEELSSVEGDGLDSIQAETIIRSYIKKLNHFREHPEDFR